MRHAEAATRGPEMGRFCEISTALWRYEKIHTRVRRTDSERGRQGRCARDTTHTCDLVSIGRRSGWV